jgi:hypothetical protein
MVEVFRLWKKHDSHQSHSEVVYATPSVVKMTMMSFISQIFVKMYNKFMARTVYNLKEEAQR